MANVSETGKVIVYGDNYVMTFEDARYHFDGVLNIERKAQLVATFAEFKHVQVITENRKETA